MVIKVESQETANLLRQLCDLALKGGGLQNLNAVVSILNSIVVDPLSKNPGDSVPQAAGKIGENE